MEDFDKNCKFYKSCGHEFCHDIDIACSDFEQVGDGGYYGEEEGGDNVQSM